ncbi:hypothetical protein AwErysi_02440 [Erysipelotrichaceae bacterium]|nr:hypothetical protein AwErysi_02440 [Erysipelotrichaceae bacterium]
MYYKYRYLISIFSIFVLLSLVYFNIRVSNRNIHFDQNTKNHIANFYQDIDLIYYEPSGHMLYYNGPKRVKILQQDTMLRYLQFRRNGETYYVYFMEQLTDASTIEIILETTTQNRKVYITPSMLKLMEQKTTYFIDEAGYYIAADGTYICTKYLEQAGDALCNEESYFHD